ncbi:hypothetical protein [uncultured Roseovarius sp.]|jgi:hypothetical protein|uniref:hypothetical protein n=1 Tax=uncultured Roseovarius sp. TaxID=293344 RepID=UPI002627864C|nr:hypothetical protein [uncultured Roseovarius sp.]
MRTSINWRLAAALLMLGTPASADVCNWRLSKLLGTARSNVAALAEPVTSAPTLVEKALGFYTLTHSVTGATLLGSTVAGSSAASTIGLIAGSGGGAGAIGAALMSPTGIVVGAIVGVGVAGTEGYCYFFQDEKVTDYAEVLLIMEGLAQNADPSYFEIDKPNDDTLQTAAIFIRGDDGVRQMYRVKDLYIVNGALIHRKWGRNTHLGNIGLEVVNSPDVYAPEADAPDPNGPEVIAPEVVAPEVIAPEVIAPDQD